MSHRIVLKMPTQEGRQRPTRGYVIIENGVDGFKQGQLESQQTGKCMGDFGGLDALGDLHTFLQYLLSGLSTGQFFTEGAIAALRSKASHHQIPYSRQPIEVSGFAPSATPNCTISDKARVTSAAFVLLPYSKPSHIPAAKA